MAKQPAVLASGISLDGGYKAIPGYTAGAQNGGQPPILIQSGLLSFTGAGTTTAFTCIPFNYTVLAAYLIITTQLTVAPATLSIGTAASTTRFVNAYSVAIANVVGTELAPTLTATLTGNSGDLIGFISGTAASAGAGYAVLVIAPRT